MLSPLLLAREAVDGEEDGLKFCLLNPTYAHDR